MDTALLVAMLLVVIGVVQSVIWFSVIHALRRLTTKLGDELRGTPILLGPERVHYQGATDGPYPRARGFVAVALTGDRLVVHRLAVRGFEVSLREIERVSAQVGLRCTINLSSSGADTRLRRQSELSAASKHGSVRRIREPLACGA